MHSYVILKQPGKAVFYLFTIMILLVVRNTYGNCHSMGPLQKLTFKNKISGGYLVVNGNTVETNTNEKRELYRIRVDRNFSLYDPRARKFICLRKVKRKRGKQFLLEARTYEQYLQWKETCLFNEQPANCSGISKSHVSFYRKDTDWKIRFKRNHTAMKKSCKANDVRHKCNCQQAGFLVGCGDNAKEEDEICPDANKFCETELGDMLELRMCCSNIRSNETTD